MKTANAVAALDTLEFLSDTIPRTVSYKKIVTERTTKGTTSHSKSEAGQMTLNGRRLASVVSDPTTTTSPEEEDEESGRSRRTRDAEEEFDDDRQDGEEDEGNSSMEDGDHYNGSVNGTINVSMNGNGAGGSLRNILDNTNGSARKRRVSQQHQQPRGEDEDEDMS